jgi:hypothetical protein
MSSERSSAYIADALDTLDQADEIEHRIRAGETVRLGTGEELRGESALPRLDAIRHGATVPLVASLAINLERIATALEAAGATHGSDVSSNLDHVTTAALSVELAHRLNNEQTDGITSTASTGPGRPV